MIVNAGLAQPWVGQTLPSHTIQVRDPPDAVVGVDDAVLGLVPIRAPPTRWA